MPGINAAVLAVYPTHASAETALNALRAKGFATSDISVVAPHGVELALRVPDSDTVPSELAPAGGGAVPAIGVALGWMAGLGAVAVSGAMFVAAGPMMLAFKGMSDAVLGIVDALTGLGISADEAKKYEERVRDGAILMTIHTADPGWILKGREIFEQTGAEDISSMYERRLGAVTLAE